MGKLTLVIGGARSGKSAFAEGLAGRERKVAYIATATAEDEEMRERILKHRLARPRTWTTYEQPAEADALLPSLAGKCDAVLFDCALLYVSNMLLADTLDRVSDAGIFSAIERLLRAARAAPFDTILVSGEVGCGVVPLDALVRRFRDVMGEVNQRLAAQADEVYYVVAGLPHRLKPAPATPAGIAGPQP